MGAKSRMSIYKEWDALLPPRHPQSIVAVNLFTCLQQWGSSPPPCSFQSGHLSSPLNHHRDDANHAIADHTHVYLHVIQKYYAPSPKSCNCMLRAMAVIAAGSLA